MTKIEQEIRGSHNQQAAGDIYNNVVQAVPGPLRVFINKVKTECEDDPNLCGFIEELSDYLNVNPHRKVIGLENKLTTAGRESFLRDAIRLKDKFARKLYKNQLSSVVQVIYSHILAYICKSFRQNVKPLLDRKESDAAITAVIYKSIVDEIYDQVADPAVGLTVEDIEGMLYFLTGQCHLEWC